MVPLRWHPQMKIGRKVISARTHIAVPAEVAVRTVRVADHGWPGEGS
ncbi:MAG: hypothetical protein ACOC9Y_09770 [Chloroflexota bacterium]